MQVSPRRKIGEGEQLVVLERLIERERTGRGDKDVLAALRAIAHGIRTRSPAQASDVAEAVGRKVASVIEARYEGRDEGPSLRSLGEKVVKEWSTLRAALTRQILNGRSE